MAFWGVRLLSAAITISALLMTGCVNMSEGSPAPVTPDSKFSSYRNSLDPRLRQQLASRDLVRELDPCGFINDAAVATIGTPAYRGRVQGFDECKVIFDPPVGPKQILSVEVHLDTAGLNPKLTRVDIDGTQATVQMNGGFCIVDVPYRGRIISYWMDSKGAGDAALAGRSSTDTCNEAQAFVRAVLPVLETKPPRRQSKGLDTRLARMDACEVLSIVGKDRPRLTVSGGFDPYWCEFMLDRDDPSTRQVLVSTQKTLEQLEYGVKKKTVIEIAGARAVIDGDSPTRCGLDLFLDEKNPHVINFRMEREPQRWVDVVEFRDYGGGCDDEAKKTAAAIVEVYNAS